MTVLKKVVFPFILLLLSCSSPTSNDRIENITIKVINNSSHIVYLYSDQNHNNYEGKVYPNNTKTYSWRWNYDKHDFEDRSTNMLYAFIEDSNGNKQSYGSFGFGGDYVGDRTWVIY